MQILPTLFLISSILLASPVFSGAESADDFILKEVITSESNTCVLSTKGQVKCWGANQFGQLGSGDLEARGEQPYTMGSHLALVDLGKNVIAENMCVGSQFSCVVSTLGAVKCWGANGNGELGQGRSIYSVGNRRDEMGDQLPFTSLGADFVAKEVHCGKSFACALNTAGKVKCWGENYSGQLGVAPGISIAIGRKKGEMGENLPYVPLKIPVQQIAVGGNHVCAASNETIYCWGKNSSGQVGVESSSTAILFPKDGSGLTITKLEDENTKIIVDQIEAGYTHTCAKYRLVTKNNRVAQKIKCWGANVSGQLGIGIAALDIGRDIGSMGANLPELKLSMNETSLMSSYANHTCIISRGKVKCWGLNNEGQLGVGDAVDRGRGENDMGENLPFVDLGLPALSLSHGPLASSACAILVNHEVKCWGYGTNGVLGYEDQENRGGGPGQMGENLPFVRIK